MTEEKSKTGRPRELKTRVTQHVSLELAQQKYCEKRSTKGVSAYIRKLIDEDMAKNG